MIAAIAAVSAAGSTEHAASAAAAKTWTTSAASAPKLTVSIVTPAALAASRNACTPLSSRGNVWAVNETPLATSPALHTTVASKASAPMTWMSSSPAASSCCRRTPAAGITIAV